MAGRGRALAARSAASTVEKLSADVLDGGCER